MLDVALGSFVTYNPVAATTTMSIAAALRLMAELDVHHLPVVDESKQVIGIVSHRDLSSSCLRSMARTNGEFTGVGHQSVATVMVSTVFTIDATASPKTALDALLVHGFHSVPVVDDGALIGMVTSSDFLRELSYGSWPTGDDLVCAHMVRLPVDHILFAAATEAEALTEEQAVLNPDDTLAHAAQQMLAYNVREMPVVDETANPIGVLREDDLLRALSVAMTI